MFQIEVSLNNVYPQMNHGDINYPYSIRRLTSRLLFIFKNVFFDFAP